MGNPGAHISHHVRKQKAMLVVAGRAPVPPTGWDYTIGRATLIAFTVQGFAPFLKKSET
jgi:hypothetical protein